MLLGHGVHGMQAHSIINLTLIEPYMHSMDVACLLVTWLVKSFFKIFHNVNEMQECSICYRLHHEPLINHVVLVLTRNVIYFNVSIYL